MKELSRAAAKRERELILERQTALEKEIKSIYKLSRKIYVISKEADIPENLVKFIGELNAF